MSGADSYATHAAAECGPVSRVFPEPHLSDAAVTVGQLGGDLRGEDHRVVQAAIDYTASLGGGVVSLLPGVYECHDRVKLRSHVTLRGVGPGVVLRKSNGFEMKLLTDGDYGESRVMVGEPERWIVGLGICVGDDSTHGWHETVATVTAIRDGELWLDRPLQGTDLLLSRNAYARHLFPVVEVCGTERVTIENVVVEGNKVTNERLNGCIGGGIYAYRCQNLTLKRVQVRDFNGDGISFQMSHDVLVENCEVSGCTGLGLHPGSGSQRPRVIGCHTHHNAEDGLFVCWRVRYGVFADNLIEGNGRHGISIGHKDTENLFEGNRILANGGHGVLFRQEPAELAANGCILRRNLVEDNGRRRADGCGIRVEGATREVLIEDNQVHCSPNGRQAYGVWLGPETDRISLSNNLVEGHAESDVWLEHTLA